MFARKVRGQLQRAAAERDYASMKQLAEEVKKGAETSGHSEDAVADTRYTPDLFVIAAEAAIEVRERPNSFCVAALARCRRCRGVRGAMPGGCCRRRPPHL